MIEFGEFPELKEERLILEGRTSTDVAFHLKYVSDPAIKKLIASNACRNIADARKALTAFYIRPFEENKSIRWDVVLKGQMEFIGAFDYFHWEKVALGLGLGMTLLQLAIGKGS